MRNTAETGGGECRFEPRRGGEGGVEAGSPSPETAGGVEGGEAGSAGQGGGVIGD